MEAASLKGSVRAILALLLGVLIGAGVVAPVAAAPARVPKVALVVGPVGSLTTEYRRLADDAAAVARAAGAEVVKAYSPNATWPAVRAAITDASIVVYLGHGNGWPSRYRDSLFPPSQNGFGLNPVAGVDDSSHQYFGEASVDQVRLAPNAVVLLHHLCYASGNTEPGLAEGTLDQAVQRVDNYASGFIRAGAKAVVAEAHMGPAWYVRQLLTTKASIETIWNHSPNANGNTLRFASDRTPGYTARLDPDHASSGFYRSLVSRGVTAADMQASAAGTPGRSEQVAGPPPEPSLTGTGVTFGAFEFASLPIAGTRTKLTIPLTAGSGNALPKGVKLGLRWDPIVLDPDPVAATDPAATGASPSPAPDPSPAPTVDPSASPSPTNPTPAPTPAPTPTVVLPEEAPDVDLVAPETLGSVVNVAALSRGRKALTINVRYPEAPGLYRVVPTLHTPAGVAYDVATQGLVSPVIVRVGRPIAVAYGVPAALVLPAGFEAALPVRVLNAGSVAWDAIENAPPSKIAGEDVPDDRTTTVRARLVATWVSTDGLEVPAQRSAPLDPNAVAPGADVAVSLDVVAPSTPGQYLLLLDVVSPAHGALSALGSAPAIVRVTVGPSADAAPGASPDPAASPSGG